MKWILLFVCCLWLFCILAVCYKASEITKADIHQLILNVREVFQ